MLLLIVDFETTGTNAQVDRPLELGTILYSVPEQMVVAQLSTLIPSPINPVESINHIKPRATQRAVGSYQLALSLFQDYLKQADYLVAHYADFDSQWLGKREIPFSSKPWLCTATDFKWPKVKRKKVSLLHLAMRYGVVVNCQHRALPDCQVIAAVFDQTQDLEDLVQQAIENRKLRMG